MEKSPEAFRTISEVADLLETPAHVLRFWETRFTQIRPVKRAGGRRYYRPSDVALLAGIRTLLHDQGMTIRGVQKVLREQGVRHVSALGADQRLLAEAQDEWAEAEALPPVVLSPAPAPSEPARIVTFPAARASVRPESVPPESAEEPAEDPAIEDPGNVPPMDVPLGDMDADEAVPADDTVCTDPAVDAIAQHPAPAGVEDAVEEDTGTAALPPKRGQLPLFAFLESGPDESDAVVEAEVAQTADAAPLREPEAPSDGPAAHPTPPQSPEPEVAPPAPAQPVDAAALAARLRRLGPVAIPVAQLAPLGGRLRALRARMQAARDARA